MNQEALSGLGFEDAATYSPRVKQEDSPIKNGFPKNNGEFIRYLLIGKGPLEILFESSQMATDIQRAMVEWLKLQSSRVFRGEGVPRGKGTVVIATGFGTTRLNYRDTARFFENIGYRPLIYVSEFPINLIPVEQTVNHFMDFIMSIEGKVKVIGHSKGGLLAYAAYATRRDEFIDKVEHVVFAGAPRPEWVNFAIGSPYFGTQIFFGGDDFKFAGKVMDNADTANIEGTKVTAISGHNDSVIQGKMMGKPDEQFEVSSSHLGMLVNSEVLRLIAYRFAESDAAKAA